MNTILLSQKEERDAFLATPGVIREKLAGAKKTLSQKLIDVVTGPRRAGKSTFAFQLLAGENFAYVDFDDERLGSVKDGEKLLQSIRHVYGDTKILFFDEIQNMPAWELFINRLQRKGYKVVITGSNASLLSRELGTHLTGRYRAHEILPFSFREFLKAQKKTEATFDDFNRYMEEGGYPEVVVDKVDFKSYLKTLYESVLFKDIVKRYSIRYPQALSKIGYFLLTQRANDFSYNKICNFLDFGSVHTVQKYVDYLYEVYLVFFTKRFSRSVKKQIKSPQKVYTYDTGLANSVRLQTSPDVGRNMENIVAIELTRRGCEFYSYQTSNGSEVDFVIQKGFGVDQIIQVCYSLEEASTKERELKALVKASTDLSCRQLLVLTFSQQGEEKINGLSIILKPLKDWLLENS